MPQYSDLKKHFSSQTYDVKKILEEFKKPIHDNLYYRNIESLRSNSDYVLFNNSKWKMRPDVFCLDHYKEYYFYPIILLINNISTIFNFTSDNLQERVIIAPYQSQIIKVLTM